MNIFEAAKHLKDGKQIRRSSWEPDEYVDELIGMIEKHIRYKHYSFNQQKFEIYLGTDGLGLDELLAEDWEIVDE